MPAIRHPLIDTAYAASAMAIGLTGLGPVAARAEASAEDGPDWPGTLKGRHRQVVDAYAPNDGFPLAFAFTFVATNGPASAGVVPASAVVVLRHTAFPLALDHPMWEKYKIGESLSILDPETKAPAAKNPFLHPKPGVLLVDDMAIASAAGAVGAAVLLGSVDAPRSRWDHRYPRNNVRCPFLSGLLGTHAGCQLAAQHLEGNTARADHRAICQHTVNRALRAIIPLA
jgi:hypothetical protein